MIDRLYAQAREGNATVAYFYFDFAAKQEQSHGNMLGAILKQVVRGLEEIPAEIKQAYQGQKNAIGWRGPQVVDIMRMLQTAASENPIFICIDGLDECLAKHRVELLNSLNQILRRSPETRVFMTGRPQIQAEVERHLSGRTIVVHITPRRHDVMSYLRCRLDKDETPNAMDSSLEADILKRITDNISEM